MEYGNDKNGCRIGRLMRVAVYARVSTREQSPDSQLHDLRQFCQARGWQIVKEFVDIGISGAKDERPALRELMQEYAKRRLIDVVLVWRFDRFARSLKHLINTLHELNDLRIHFASYQENLDTSTAQGRLVFSLVGAIAEFERELARERIMSGLRNARAKGTQLGRPEAEFDVAEAVRLHAEGRSLRDLAGHFNVSAATLSRVLQNHVRNSPNAPVEEVKQ